MASEKDKEKEQQDDEELEGPPTVLFCPQCDSTNILFVRGLTVCQSCGNSW